jgi:hypothetical protein
MRAPSLVLVLAPFLAACGDPSAPTPPVTTTPAPPETAHSKVAGYWDGETSRWHLRLEQRGTQLTGILLGHGDDYFRNAELSPELAITGTIGKGLVSFQAEAFGLRFGGYLEPDGLRMIGTISEDGHRYGEILVKQSGVRF